jgi:ferredoxin-NADP reductase
MKFFLDRVKQETADASSFIFRPEAPFTWQAGQYLHYSLPHPDPDARKTERYFTISSAVHEGKPMITTRLSATDPSSFKRALWAMKPGETIEASGPSGTFIIDDTNREFIFIAGGIGITPFRAILLDLDERKLPMNVTLMYANRTEDIIFKDELAALAAKHPSLKIIYFIGENKIDEAAIKNAVPDLNRPVFYVSGPEPMVQAFEKILRDMGVTDDRLKRDYFPGYDWP